MNTLPYLAVRLALWVVAVGIAAVPAMSAAGGVSFSYVGELAAINEAHAFRDAVFVLVPAAALAISSVLDFFCRALQLSQGTLALTILALLVNTVGLVCGAVGFFTIPDNHASGVNQFSTYCWIIGIGLIFSLLTEVGVTFAHGNHAKKHPHPGNGKRKTPLDVPDTLKNKSKGEDQ